MTLKSIHPFGAVKRIVFLAMACTMVLTAQAQYDVSFTNYWALQRFYNPATAGKDPMLNFDAAYSSQMSGFEGAPNVMYAGVDLPLFFWGPNHGVGAGFFNDKIGLFNHQKMFVQYALHLQHVLGGTLSVGAQLNLLSESFDGSKADLIESNDPAFSSSDIKGSGFDIGAGVYYERKEGYAGLSVMHANSPVVELGDSKTNQINISPSYFFTAGSNIKLRNPFISIHPSALVMTDWTDWRADITCRGVYNNENRKFYGGVSYSPSHSVSFLIGGIVHGVRLGYSYEMYTSGMGAAHGSHELVVGYQTELNMMKKGKNKHKSVRFL